MNPEDRFKQCPWWIVQALDHAGNTPPEIQFVAGAKDKIAAQESCQNLNTSALAMGARDRYRAIERLAA